MTETRTRSIPNPTMSYTDSSGNTWSTDGNTGWHGNNLKFQVGEWVKINKKGNRFHGKIGKILEVDMAFRNYFVDGCISSGVIQHLMHEDDLVKV